MNTQIWGYPFADIAHVLNDAMGQGSGNQRKMRLEGAEWLRAIIVGPTVG